MSRHVSSAYSLGRQSVEFGKSLMYNKKSRGPRVEPWETPYVISLVSKLNPFILVYCFLVRKDVIKRFAGPRIP